MNPWTIGAALWLAAATAIAAVVGRAIATADREATAARQRHADHRAHIVSRYPTVTLDGRVPHHIAVHVIRQAQHEQAWL